VLVGIDPRASAEAGTTAAKSHMPAVVARECLPAGRMRPAA
jgi:hypothetical protein